MNNLIRVFAICSIVVVFSLKSLTTAQDNTGFAPITVESADRVVELTAFENPSNARYFAVAISPDSNLIAVGDLEGNIHILSTSDLSITNSISTSGIVRDLIFNIDGTQLFSTSWSSDQRTGQVFSIDPLTGDEVFRLDYEVRVGDIALSPDGTELATASQDYIGSNLNLVRIWNSSNGDAIEDIEGIPDWISDVEFSLDNHTIGYISNNTLRTLNRESKSTTSEFIYELPIFTGDSPLPGAWSLSSRPNNQSIFVYFIINSARDQVVSAVIFAFDTRIEIEEAVAIDNNKFSLDIPGLTEFECEFTTQIEANCSLIGNDFLTITQASHEDPSFSSLSISPDSSYVALATSDGTIQIWDIENQAVAHILGESYASSAVYDVSYISDGTLLVSLDEAGHLIIWDINGESVLVDLDAHENGRAIAINSEGTLIASIGDTDNDLGILRLWGIPE